MKIGILGTGRVGSTIAGRLAELGHDVMIGSRDPSSKQDLAVKLGGKTKVGTMLEAAKYGEILFNTVPGRTTLETLTAIGEANLSGRVLVDVANVMDFSHGSPPSLLVANTDSLAEEIQRTFPKTRVVKTLNTLGFTLMTHPENLAKGDHAIFLCGNDAFAKTQVTEILASFGWKQIYDLGDIRSARGMEMYLVFRSEVLAALGNAPFNIKIVH
jgi:predicted dinucleotide-binding enzyme